MTVEVSFLEVEEAVPLEVGAESLEVEGAFPLAGEAGHLEEVEGCLGVEVACPSVVAVDLQEALAVTPLVEAVVPLVDLEDL